ncbi:MAG: tryptophan-rich sensory protein [Candidatus Bathyarchaeota archaeon]|nr:tryptophan-rich sensory protein [Candidatus Bathyarchaeota archaeon]
MSQIKGNMALQIFNVVAFLALVIVNGLATTTLLNGRTTAEVSGLYPTLITPAGFTFSIWGIIYVLLLVFVVFQLLPRHRQDAFHGQIGYLFALSSVFNVVWLFLWQHDYITVSVALMFALLTSLVAIYLRLQIGKSKVPFREKLCVHLPFSVYLGWITVASIANVATALVSVNWDGFGISEATWAVLVIAIALIVTLAVLATKRDIAYGLVIIWALAGITVNQSGNPDVVTTAEVSAIITAIAIIVVGLASKLKRTN